MDPAQALGLNVLRSPPSQRGFSQPCPLWQGHCTVYTSPHYPRFCRTYKCKLLKQVLEENAHLPQARRAIEAAKELIDEVQALLPASRNPNFRERLVAEIENRSAGQEFREKAEQLLEMYEAVFGVSDVVDPPPANMTDKL